MAYHQVDMIGDHYSFASDVCDVAWRDADVDSRYAALPLFSHLRDYCRWLDERQPQIRTIMGLLARRQAAPVVYHCEAGKDRTGVVTALLLLLAGVPDLAIAADYTHTARNNFRRLELLHGSGNQPLAMRDAAEYARALLSGRVDADFPVLVALPVRRHRQLSDAHRHLRRRSRRSATRFDHRGLTAENGSRPPGRGGNDRRLPKD